MVELHPLPSLNLANSDIAVVVDKATLSAAFSWGSGSEPKDARLKTTNARMGRKGEH